MERILDFEAFIWAMITIVMLCTGIFLNIKLATKFKKSFMLYLIHFFTLFVLITLSAYSMSVAVENIPVTYTYALIAQISGLLACVVLSVGVLVHFIFEDKFSFQDVALNLSHAFEKLDELVFVVDSDGTITHINHQDQFEQIFGQSKTLVELFDFIEACGFESNEVLSQKKRMLESFAIEMSFPAQEVCYFFDMRPVIMKSGQLVGFTAVIQNMTEIKKSEITLEKRNGYLEQANAKLNHYVTVSSALEAENERLLVIDHLQKTLISQIEQSLHHLRHINMLGFKEHTYSDDLKELSHQLREIYKEIRSSVDKMSRKES